MYKNLPNFLAKYQTLQKPMYYVYVQIFPILVHCVAASTLVQQQTVDEEIWKLAPQKRDALGW